MKHSSSRRRKAPALQPATAPAARAPNVTMGGPDPGAPGTAAAAVSPRWSASAKLLVGITGIALAAVILIRFSGLLRLLVISAILTFLLVPVVRQIHQRARLSWRLSTHAVFLILILMMIVGFTATGLALAQQVQSLVLTFEEILQDLPELLHTLSQSSVALGPVQLDLSQFDLASLADQALTYVQPFLGGASGVVTALAGGAIETLAKVAFIMAAAYFFTLDQPVFTKAWKRPVLPGFQYDWDRLVAALDRIWAAFLRGQIVLGLVIAAVVTVGLSILGVRNALVLGLVSGLLEFIPILGPFIAGAIAVLVAFFQGSNWWGLTAFAFALIVAAFFIVIQQLENNLLVPRIMGRALRLHPVVILVAAVIGATLAGVLGILLSGPTVATLILLGRYVYRKVFDLPPWDPPIDGGPETEPTAAQPRRAFWRRRT